MPIRLDILELEKIKNNGKIDRTFDWFRKEQNMQPAYYLLKLRANSLTSPKNWEVGLKGRMTPASSIPLQSKDTALFQRDLNNKEADIYYKYQPLYLFEKTSVITSGIIFPLLCEFPLFLLPRSQQPLHSKL